MQDHIITQWTRIQAELASFTFPTIGSISRFSKDTGAVIDRLCVAEAEGFDKCGPFASSEAYFAAVGRARYLQACKENEGDGGEGDVFSRLGPYIFHDIVNKTALFNGPSNYGPFHFNHMDMGTQNILVDDDFNFLAIIDWEFAQSAPWEVNHFPMPFPLTSSDKEIEDILKDPGDIAYPNVSRQHNTRQMYRRAFEKAEKELELSGRPLKTSIASVLEGPASRIYGILEKIDVFPGQAESLTYEMVRLAFEKEGEEATKYVEKMKTDEIRECRRLRWR